MHPKLSSPPARRRPLDRRPARGRQRRPQPAGLQPGHRRRRAPGGARHRGRTSTRAVAAAQAAFPAWADTPPIRRARVLNALPRAAQPAARHAGRDHHRRARQGVHRRAGRGDARHRHRRVRLRHSAAAEGRLHRPGRHRHRQLDAAPAARRGGRHHAVQLPGAWCRCWMFPVAHRLRQHLRAQAQRARPVAVADHGRAAEAGRAARRRVQRRAGRQGGGRRAARRIPT